MGYPFPSRRPESKPGRRQQRPLVHFAPIEHYVSQLGVLVFGPVQTPDSARDPEPRSKQHGPQRSRSGIMHPVEINNNFLSGH